MFPAKSSLLGLSLLLGSTIAAPTDNMLKRDGSACHSIQTGSLRILDDAGASYDMVAGSDTFIAAPASSNIVKFSFDVCDMDFLGYPNGATRTYNKASDDTVTEFWGKLKLLNKDGQEDNFCLTSSYGNFWQYKTCSEDDSQSTHDQIFRLQQGSKGNQISFYPIKNNVNGFVYSGQDIFYFQTFKNTATPQVLQYSYNKSNWRLQMI
jgi:hypothetical protein